MSNLISQERRGSLQRQLILWINASLIALTIAALLFDYYTQKKILIDNFHSSMKQAADHIILALDNSPTMESATNTLHEYCSVMSGHQDEHHEITLLDKSGKILVSSRMSNESNNSRSSTEIPNTISWNAFSIGKDTYIELIIPFSKQWPTIPLQGALRYIENTKSIDTLLEVLFWNRAISLIVILIVLSLITFLILKSKVLTPLDRIFVQSYAVSKGDYEIWDLPDPGNEIGDIQIMFNYMIEKIRIHENSAVSKGKHSATVETIAQSYQAVVNGISRIRTTCNSLQQEKGGDTTRLKQHSAIIKNETDAIMDKLSSIIIQFEGENEIDNPQKSSQGEIS